MLQAYTAKLPPGPWLMFSHFTPAEDGTPQDRQTVQAVREAYTKTTDPFWPRNHVQISALLDKLTEWQLLDPGLVHARLAVFPLRCPREGIAGAARAAWVRRDVQKTWHRHPDDLSDGYQAASRGQAWYRASPVELAGSLLTQPDRDQARSTG